MKQEKERVLKKLELQNEGFDLEVKKDGCMILDYGLYRRKRNKIMFFTIGMLIVVGFVMYAMGYYEAMETIKDSIIHDWNTSCNALIEGAKGL